MSNIKIKFLYFFYIFNMIFSYYTTDIYKIFDRRLYPILFFILPILIIIVIKNIKFYVNFIKNNRKFTIYTIIFMLVLRNYYLGFLLVFLLKKISKKERIKYFIISSILLYLTTILLYLSGALSKIDIGGHFKLYNNVLLYRNTLGFSSPNTPMMLLLPIFCSVYYLYFPKKKYLKYLMYIIYLIISTIIFSLTISRTTYLLIIIFIILIAVKDKILIRLKNIITICSILPPIFSIVIPQYFYNEKLNQVLSLRLWLFRKYLSEESITIFGNFNIYLKYGEQPLDNVFLRVLFENGIIGFICLILLSNYVIRDLYKRKDYRGVRIFLIIILFSIFESQGILYYINMIYMII